MHHNLGSFTGNLSRYTKISRAKLKVSAIAALIIIRPLVKISYEPSFGPQNITFWPIITIFVILELRVLSITLTNKWNFLYASIVLRLLFLCIPITSHSYQSYLDWSDTTLCKKWKNSKNILFSGVVFGIIVQWLAINFIPAE